MKIFVASKVIPNVRFTGSTILLRIYARQRFVASDDTIILPGSPQGGQIYKELTCTLSGGNLTIPAFEIDSTTDAKDDQTATYVCYFFSSNGTQIRVWEGFESFEVPGGTTPTTWADIQLYNSTNVPHQDTLTYNRLVIDGFIAELRVLIGTVNNPILSGLPTASLPAANGALQLALDGLRSVYLGNGSRAVPLFGDRINVMLQGADSAKGNGRILTDGAMSAGSNILTSASAALTNSDVGKFIDVNGAGIADELAGTVIERISATQIRVDTYASFSASGVALEIGGRTVNDAAMTAGSNIITSATANFQTYDLERRVRMLAVGARNKVGTIQSIIDAHTAVLSFSAVGVVSHKQVVYGSDDAPAARAAVASGASAIYFPKPPGDCYIFASKVGAVSGEGTIQTAIAVTSSNKTFIGDGRESSKIYVVGPVYKDNSNWFNGITVVSGVSNVELRDLALHGTNVDGQRTGSAQGSADGFYIGVFGPISNMRAIGCRFNNFWIIGLHAPGQTLNTVVKDFTFIDCEAHRNSADGFNPCPGKGQIMIGCRAYDNGTGGFEVLGASSSYIANLSKHNFSSGFSIGGLGDPQVEDSIAATGNVAEFNADGFALGTNVRGLNFQGNVARRNYVQGVDIHDAAGFGEMTQYNRIANNIMSSNGGTGGATVGLGISVNGTTRTLLEQNTVQDEGLPGFTQSLGILARDAVGLEVVRNRVSGHGVQDYNFTNCGDVLFVDESANPNIFSTGTTFIYPTVKFTGITNDGEEILTPLVLADTALAALPVAGRRVIYTTLTGNRSLSPFDGTDGQLLTVIAVQDGTGNRTLTYGGIRGATNISAGQAAGKANIQTFIFRTGLGWIAYTAAVQNM